ncbi:zinc transporter binding subunit ZevA [Pasteurella oralis]|uniref:Zinc transporter binding subunit ZevA n=1 Tax=Pasteurella oralis TaxID=1071947 RepID=A0ABW4NTM5_9PAST|nr:zinc transporter binding subunit ZevA [Pasteurella oralis]
MKAFSISILLFFMSLFSFNLYAHPHAFIEMKTKVLASEQKLIGFSMEWILDEASSATMLYDIRQTRGDKKALQKLIDEVMGNIINEHYFSYLFDKQGNKVKYSAKPQNYGMRSNNNQVMYYFDFLLSKPRELANNQFTLLTYDPTYYVSMYYDQTKQSAVDFSQISMHCHGEVVEPQVDAKIKQYANSLDQTQRDEDDSLGVLFAQKVMLICE